MTTLGRWSSVAAVLSGALLFASCSAQSNDGGVEVSNSNETRNTTPRTTHADWPRFRGPAGTGISDATGLPLTWGQGENVAWTQTVPGAGSSSPIVQGDHVYVTSYSGYLVPGEPEGRLKDLQRHLSCLDQNDGTLLWSRAVKAKLPEGERVRDHGYAASTPAADADRVYMFFGRSGVHAYDHEGNALWNTDVGSNTHEWGTGASPVLYEELVFINASVESESLIALDRETGEERWRARGINEAWNTPLVVRTAEGADELLIATHGKIRAFDPRSGEALWTCDTDISWYMVPSPVAADGIAYFLGGRSGTAALAVRTGGRGDVTATHRLWTSKKGSNVSSPVYRDGYLYWVHEQRGTAYCARAETGEVVYEERLDGCDQVYASALLADGRLYYLDRAGKTFVLAAKPAFELLRTNDLRDGSIFDASPAVRGNQLLLRSNTHLYCIGG